MRHEDYSDEVSPVRTGFVVTDTVVRVMLILLALGVTAFLLRLPSSQVEGA